MMSRTICGLDNQFKNANGRNGGIGNAGGQYIE